MFIYWSTYQLTFGAVQFKIVVPLRQGKDFGVQIILRNILFFDGLVETWDVDRNK